MPDIIDIVNLSKTYKGGFQALKDVSLKVREGEIFALLGPNGAGKTTLIGTVCGLVTPSKGTICVGGHDVIKEFRAARSLIGLVPQELSTDMFETVWDTVTYTRGLFGKPRNRAYIEQTLKSLSLWDKKDNRIMTLSGGMKRRVMIAKALSHEPRVLFLDEPTAGVDVELRKSMWNQVRALRDSGVTIILTTHYIEEAEELADRVGVITHGKLLLTEQTELLMKEMGEKSLTLHLTKPLSQLPASLSPFKVNLEDEGRRLTFLYDTRNQANSVAEILNILRDQNLEIFDVSTEESSLEDIFVKLVQRKES